jgi:ornithine cyclodeaminase/alanine dehydrogenase-like protein (mu-crystallin family)
MMCVRGFERVRVWGRDAEKARGFAERMEAELGVEVRAAESVREVVAEADVVCTLTSAAEPILMGEWLRPGTHVNVVGSSYAGPAEVDNELVRRSRFVVDSRASVLAAGAEFLRAKAAGLVGDEHIVGEIGEVLAGDVAGRQTEEEITVYKSLGHVVQDLACAWVLYTCPARAAKD